MSSVTANQLPAGNAIKPKLGKDDWIMRGFIAVIAIYLIVALAFPLYAMLSKAFSTFNYDLAQYEFQVSNEEGQFDETIFTAAQLNDQLQIYKPGRSRYGLRWTHAGYQIFPRVFFPQSGAL